MRNKRIIKSEVEAKQICLKRGYPFPSFEMLLLAMLGLDKFSDDLMSHGWNVGDNELKGLIIKTLDMACRELDRQQDSITGLCREIYTLREMKLFEVLTI